MNERIEHISKQVDEYFDDLSVEFSRQAWVEKFAELIVKECCNVLYDNEMGGYQVNYVLKEHFGVEE